MYLYFILRAEFSLVADTGVREARTYYFSNFHREIYINI